jgi:hypothetical protein
VSRALFNDQERCHLHRPNDDIRMIRFLPSQFRTLWRRHLLHRWIVLTHFQHPADLRGGVGIKDRHFVRHRAGEKIVNVAL